MQQRENFASVACNFLELLLENIFLLEMPWNSRRSRKRKFTGNQFMSDCDNPKKFKRFGASTSRSACGKGRLNSHCPKQSTKQLIKTS